MNDTSDVGLLAALFEGYSFSQIAHAYNANELEIRRRAQNTLDDILAEFGLRHAFRLYFGGRKAGYIEFLEWIEVQRGVSWTAVLSEREAIEAVEIVAYIRAHLSYAHRQLIKLEAECFELNKLFNNI